MRNYKWQKERGLLENFSIDTEVRNLLEEIDELKGAKNDNDAIDALCDIIVFATAAIMKKGYKVNDCMNETFKELESRTGSIGADGKFYKDTSDAAKARWYKADYSKYKMEEPG